MAIKTCDEVINGASYAGGEGYSGKQVTRDSDAANGSTGGDFLDAVIRAADRVNAQANALYQYDCSEHLMEWIYSVCPSLKTVGNTIDSVVNKLNSISTGVAIGDLVQGNSVTQKICDMVLTLFGTVNSWLEMITKAAFALFDKIDAARQRMQSALTSLTDAVMKCILDVYDMIETFLTTSLKMSLNLDWEAIENFLIDCPCICRFVAWVTGCDEDDDGNNISDQPDKVVYCIRDKFWFLDGLNLATGLSAIMDDYIKKYIVLMFDAISLAIDNLFELFIKPFRALIKMYANLLRKQWDVTFMISPLRSSHLDCLLLYQKEVDEGETVYTMSVLDMMASMKMWVNCLEYPCPALSERIKNRVRKFNEEMRLTGEYWDRAYEYDIYTCCMAADNSRGPSLEEMASMWSDWYDRLQTCNSRAKDRVSFAKVTYGLVGTGAIDWDTGKMRQAQPGKSTTPENPVLTAAVFSDTPDRENDVNVGDRPLSSQEDDDIRRIGMSVAAGCREDTYFVEKWYQYLRFAGQYRLSDSTVNELRGLRDSAGRMKADFTGGYETNFPARSARSPADMDETEREPNYWVDSDYDESRVRRIEGIGWTGMKTGESLSSYYARMYATAV